MAVLHTWGQNLHHHPHVHCVVTGGGLSCNERGEVDANPRWVSCRPGFFLPVPVLRRLFRGKFLAGLRTLFLEGKLRMGGRLAGLGSAAEFAAWLDPLRNKEWVVHAKAPFGGPAQVLKYLARYTHRVAISNHRLVELSDGEVTFRYKDYAKGHEQKLMTLSAEEFLRRFVQHVLPKGFVKIRHYGLLANRYREERLHTARRLLLVVMVLSAITTQEPEPCASVEPTKPVCCPQCGGKRGYAVNFLESRARLLRARIPRSRQMGIARGGQQKERCRPSRTDCAPSQTTPAKFRDDNVTAAPSTERKPQPRAKKRLLKGQNAR